MTLPRPWWAFTEAEHRLASICRKSHLFFSTLRVSYKRKNHSGSDIWGFIRVIGGPWACCPTKWVANSGCPEASGQPATLIVVCNLGARGFG